MPNYQVYIVQTVSAMVDVEADTPEDAAEAFYDSPEMPGSITHGAFGSASATVSEAGEWSPVSVYDEAGEEVYREVDDRAVELEMLRTRVAALESQRKAAAAFISWLTAMDDPQDTAGREARRTVTLTQIIDRAAKVRAELGEESR